MRASTQELSWFDEAPMNREELFASIVAARPDREDTVYLERRADSYSWRIMLPGRFRHRDAVGRPGRLDVLLRHLARGSDTATGILRRPAGRTRIDGRPGRPVSMAARRPLAAFPLKRQRRGFPHRP